MFPALTEIAASPGGCPGTPKRGGFPPSSRDFPGGGGQKERLRVPGWAPEQGAPSGDARAAPGGSGGGCPPHGMPRSTGDRSCPVPCPAEPLGCGVVAGRRRTAGGTSPMESCTLISFLLCFIFIFLFLFPLGRLCGERGTPALPR